MNAWPQTCILAIGLSTLYTAVAAVLARVLLTKLDVASPRIHRCVWVLVILQGWLLLPLTVQLPVGPPPRQSQIASSPPVYVDGELPQSPQHTELAATAAAEQPKAAEVNLQSDADSQAYGTLLMCVLWGAGLATVVFRFGRRYLRLLRQMPLGRAPERVEWESEWSALLESASTRWRVQLRMTHNTGPLLCFVPFGYFVLTPQALWTTLTRAERVAILKHELAHLKRADLWKSLAVRVLALPQWFNPAVWWAVRKFDEAGEWACDDVARGISRGESLSYAKTLVRLSENLLERSPCSTAANGGVLSERIGRLISPRNTEDRVMKKLLAVAVLIGVSFLHVVQIRLVAKEIAQVERPKQAAQQDEKSGDRVATIDAKQLEQTGLVPYRIEPPDVVRVVLVSPQPKASYRFSPLDIVHVAVTVASDKHNFVGRFQISPSGQVDLKQQFGSVHIAQLTVRESASRIRAYLADKAVGSAVVTVALVKPAGGIDGKHLVGPDGNIDLGIFGKVYVNGRTTAKARTAIEKRLSRHFDGPQVYVHVSRYNSKVVYVIIEGSKGMKKGESAVIRMPCTTATSVYGVLTSLDVRKYLQGAQSPTIWIARPTHNNANSQTRIPVHWPAIMKTALPRPTTSCCRVIGCLLDGTRATTSVTTRFARISATIGSSRDSWLAGCRLRRMMVRANDE